MASHLHKYVFEIEEEMPVDELYEWNEYFGMENERMEAERKKSKSKSKPDKTPASKPKRPPRVSKTAKE